MQDKACQFTTIKYYTLSEVEIPGYVSNITATCCGNFIITNTHEDSVVELNITKVWNDSDDNDRIRPANITVEVLANGQRYSIISINATANWRYTLNNLPEYLNGTKVNYTIREINVAKGYTSTINGTQITNTHIPEITQITKLLQLSSAMMVPKLMLLYVQLIQLTVVKQP